MTCACMCSTTLKSASRSVYVAINAMLNMAYSAALSTSIEMMLVKSAACACAVNWLRAESSFAAIMSVSSMLSDIDRTKYGTARVQLSRVMWNGGGARTYG